MTGEQFTKILDAWVLTQKLTPILIAHYGIEKVLEMLKSK